MSIKAHHIWIDDYITPEVNEFTGQPKGISQKFVKGEVEKAIANGAEKIILHINSGGGSVFEGFGIYNLLTGAGIPIESRIISLSASITTLIMLAGEDNTIIMSPTSQLMFHKPSVQTQGNSDDHAKSVEELKNIEDLMAERYAHKMGKSIEEGHALMSKGDYFVNPKVAKEMGMIDLIEHPKVAKSIKIYHNNNEMAKTNLNPKAAAMINNLTALLFGASDEDTPTPTAGSIRLADGETIIYFDGDTLEVGKAVFTDEAMTSKAPEGAHDLEDGRQMIVDAAGICIELREMIIDEKDKELQAANARIEALEAENATLKAEKQAAETSASTATAKLADVAKQFTALKATLTSGDSGVKGENGGKPASTSIATETKGIDKALEKISAKLKAAKEGKL